MLFRSNPTAIAICEALRLYPGRPLGVIMSLGVDTLEDELSCRAIDIARQYHPNLHFHRLIPTKVLDKLGYRETDPEVITSFQRELRHFLETDEETNELVDTTIDKLYYPEKYAKGPLRAPQSWEISTYTNSTSSSLLSSESTSSTASQHQNRVFDPKKGWIGYESPKSIDVVEELEKPPRSRVSLLFRCFRKNRKRRNQQGSRATSRGEREGKTRPIHKNAPTDGAFTETKIYDLGANLDSAFSSDSYEKFDDDFPR